MPSPPTKENNISIQKHMEDSQQTPVGKSGRFTEQGTPSKSNIIPTDSKLAPDLSIAPSENSSKSPQTPVSTDSTGTKLSFEFNPLSPLSPEELISKQDRGDTKIMSDALNRIFAHLAEDRAKMNVFMQRSEEQFFHLRESVGSLSERMGALENTSREGDNVLAFLNEDKLSCNNFEEFRTEVNEFKQSCLDSLKEVRQINSNQQQTIDKQQAELNSLCKLKQANQSQQAMIDQQQAQLARLHLENERLYSRQSLLAEKQNVQEIRDKHLVLMIDGLPEKEEGTTMDCEMTRLNDDVECTLESSDFLAAFRVGKVRPTKVEGQEKQPRQIKLKLANEAARNKILACRGKTKPNANKTQVWINEDHPDEYRRRKIMLKGLVKQINKKEGYTPSFESGGIRLNGQFYGPDSFDDLPEDCQPGTVQVITTQDNGLAFAGEWAFLSNMLKCPVRYADMDFTSSEQIYQFV